jgi:hypothetical protein
MYQLDPNRRGNVKDEGKGGIGPNKAKAKEDG